MLVNHGEAFSHDKRLSVTEVLKHCLLIELTKCGMHEEEQLVEAEEHVITCETCIG